MRHLPLLTFSPSSPSRAVVALFNEGPHVEDIYNLAHNAVINFLGEDAPMAMRSMFVGSIVG